MARKKVTNNTDKYEGLSVMGKKVRTDRGTSPKDGSFDTKGGQSK